MRRSRVLAAAVAAALSVSVVALSSGVAADPGTDEVLAQFCPDDEVPVLLGGDDFETASSSDPENKLRLDWNITDGGAFQIAESTTTPGWHVMHGATPVAAGITSVESTSPIELPSGKPLAVTINTWTDFPAGTRPIVDLGVDGTWHRIGEFPARRITQGTTLFDLGAYAGRNATVRFSIDATNATVIGRGMGWHINNVKFYSCDPATVPGMPRSTRVWGELWDGGRARVDWWHPESGGTNVPTKYEVTVEPGSHVREVAGDKTETTFTGLDPDTTYTASVRAFTAAGSGPPATTELVPTKTATTQSATTLVYGQSVTIRGKVTRTDTGQPLADHFLQPNYQPIEAFSWHRVDSAHTRSDGTFSYVHKPTASIRYRVDHPARPHTSTSFWESQGNVHTVAVRMKTTGAFADSAVSRGSLVTFRGSVAPKHQGKTIYFQRRRADGSWSTEKSMKLTAKSTYWFSRSFGSKGWYYYRAYIPGHADHAGGWSPTRKVTVS